MSDQNNPVNTVDDDISSFIADNSPDATDDVAPPQKGELEAELDAEETEPTETESSTTDETESDETEPTEKPVAASTLNKDGVVKALEGKDLKAFFDALPEDLVKEMFSSSAHKTLRLQLKDVEKQTKANLAAQDKARELATALEAKYGDPIAARAAATNGDVDAFIDIAEKWAGTDWTSIIKWVSKGLQGRPERLEAKKQETSKGEQVKTAEQEKATQEAKAWIGTVLGKTADAALVKEFPEVVDMVFETMRKGMNAGVDSPQKAMKTVRQELIDQYNKLHKTFGKIAKPKTSTPSPSSKVGKVEAANTREQSVEELIAEFVKESR